MLFRSKSEASSADKPLSLEEFGKTQNPQNGTLYVQDSDGKVKAVTYDQNAKRSGVFEKGADGNFNVTSASAGDKAAASGDGTSAEKAMTREQLKALEGSGGVKGKSVWYKENDGRILQATYDANGTWTQTVDQQGTVVSAGQGQDRKSTRLNSSHIPLSRMPSSA